MPPTTEHPGLPAAIQQLLDGVRRRIRAYIWLQGLAMLVVLVGGAFWLGLALDWYFEPSPAVRRGALIAFGAAALYVCYRYLLRRILVPISNTSAAVLLERRFPALQDHLLTAVDVGSKTRSAYDPQLIQQSRLAAEEAVQNVNAGQLFNPAPLIVVTIAASVLLSAAFWFVLLAPRSFGFWLERIALSDELWPRRVSLQVVGFAPDSTGQRTHKLAQDDDFELLVRADIEQYEAPEEVEIRFRLADGRRGRDTLIRVGEADFKREQFQTFRYEFKRVSDDMEFDVVGGDDRVEDLRLAVVDRPELLAIELECVYPSYLGRDSRRLPVTGGMRIPEGTSLTLHARSTKPLTHAHIRTSKDDRNAELSFATKPEQSLRWEYGALAADDVILITMTDSDGVTSREPYRISLAVVKDELPQVAVRLAGVSSAITPDAVLPLAGKVTDDYGLERAWIEYQVDGGSTATRELVQQPSGSTVLDKLGSFDTREADAATGKRALELRPGQRLALSLKAADSCNLPRTENAAATNLRAGSSQVFALEVVTPADLLALLERRELALRQRYEAIFNKVTDTRNLLGRVDFNETIIADAPLAEGEPASEGDEEAADSSGPATASRALARRRLRISGSLQNVMQAADEVAGIAEAFDDLGDELTNNRIDNPDLSSRLREQIARPLHRIAEVRMPQLAAELKLVEEHVADAATAAGELATATTTADEILVEMRQVFDRMLELETYNEVVALLRGIITDQDDLNRRTKERKTERIRSLFE